MVKDKVDEATMKDVIRKNWPAMETAIKQGKSPVEVLDKPFRTEGIDRGDDGLKRKIGRLVRDECMKHGYEPMNTSYRMPPGNVFATGMRYAKV